MVFEAPLPGTLVFGRFTLLRFLYQTGHGGVALACANWGDSKGKIVVLKIVTQKAQPYIVSQIKNEIKILSNCDSLNVIKFYDWFEDELYVGYSMEYAPYGTLEDFIDRNGITSVDYTLSLLHQLALGIHEIHAQGYIHRDLKPQNIFLTSDMTLKVGDLGIALHHQHATKISIDEITGTVDFLSPEYISRGICTVQSDIYAWGSIGYLLLTGLIPFKEDSIVETLLSKASLDPVAPSAFRADLPEHVTQLIMKAIARDPKDRFQSTFDLVRAILSSIHELDAVATSGDQKLVA